MHEATCARVAGWQMFHHVSHCLLPAFGASAAQAVRESSERGSLVYDSTNQKQKVQQVVKTKLFLLERIASSL